MLSSLVRAVEPYLKVLSRSASPCKGNHIVHVRPVPVSSTGAEHHHVAAALKLAQRHSASQSQSSTSNAVDVE